MRKDRLTTAVAALAVLAAGFPATTHAARAPTRIERVYITRALPAYDRSLPAGCVFFDTRVSTQAPYARVDPVYLVDWNRSSDPCARYAANGFYLLRRVSVTRWRIVHNGSDPPPCSLHIPRDLTTCLR